MQLYTRYIDEDLSNGCNHSKAFVPRCFLQVLILFFLADGAKGSIIRK